MDVPELRRAAKRIRDEEKPDLAAAKRMLDAAHGQPEFVVASLVFMRHRGKLKEEDWDAVARWAQAVESREAADVFAQYVAAPLHKELPNEEIVTRWTESAEPLLRRLALRVSGMEVAERLVGDEDAIVQEALIDALREHAETNEVEVYEFLRQHDDAPRAVMRGAAAALSTEYALALTTGRLPKRARSKPRKKDTEREKKAAARRRREAITRAKAEEERAARQLAEAQAALERARGRVDDLADP